MESSVSRAVAWSALTCAEHRRSIRVCASCGELGTRTLQNAIGAYACVNVYAAREPMLHGVLAGRVGLAARPATPAVQARDMQYAKMGGLACSHEEITDNNTCGAQETTSRARDTKMHCARNAVVYSALQNSTRVTATYAHFRAERQDAGC